MGACENSGRGFRCFRYIARSTRQSAIRGHHIYKQILRPLVGEILTLEREEGNNHDKFAVSLLKDATVIRHGPGEFKFAGVLALPQARRDHHLWRYRSKKSW